MANLFVRHTFLLIISLIASAAQGAVIYEYRFDQSQYFVLPGQVFTVNVYLRETFEPGDSTLLDSEGLFGAGVRVTFDGSPAPSDPAKVVANTDIAPNILFDGATSTDIVPGSSAGFTAIVDVASAAVTSPTGTTFNEILLGQFTFTAGMVTNEVTQLLATDFDPATDDNVTNASLTVLDSRILTASATVTVVPEPATMVLMVSFMAPLAFGASRARKSSLS